MTNDERAQQTASQIRQILSTLRTGQENNPFASIGPSQSFLDTHLPGNVATEEEIASMETAIDKAVADGDMATINKVLGVVAQNFIPGLKQVLGVLS